MEAPSPCPCLVISPHRDDACFSLGGAIYQWQELGREVTVVNLFTGHPGPRLSPQAQAYHQRFGASDLMELRRQRDQEALEILGVPSIDLNHQDCLYRLGNDGLRWRYPDPEHIFGNLHPEEGSLPHVLVDSLRCRMHLTAATLVLAPLAVGNHVDHQLAHRMGRLLAEEGLPVAFYEDAPYVFSPQGPQDLTIRSRGMNAEVLWLEQRHMEGKRKAIGAYRSPVPIEAFAAYSQSFAGGHAAERIWRLPSAV
ncbi:MAG: PIG-L family deacetylase [Cyanobacteriota bacterium]|nr:PIG-L family deacetylase [Cyanobacteriota bacterium]